MLVKEGIDICQTNYRSIFYYHLQVIAYERTMRTINFFFLLLLLFFEKRAHPIFLRTITFKQKKSVKFFQCFENIRKKRNAVQLNVYFRGCKRKLKRKKKEARFHETSRWSKHREEQIHKERSWKNLPSAFKAR